MKAMGTAATVSLSAFLLTWSVAAHAAVGSVEVHVAGPATVALMVGTRAAAMGEVAKDAQGCLLESINEGTYVLVVSAPGCASVMRTVTVSGGKQTEVSLELRKLTQEERKKLGRVVGFVKDQAGQPVQNATVALLNIAGKTLGVGRPVNATGVYELGWYPPGRYIVVAHGTRGEQRVCALRPVVITAGASARVDFELTFAPKPAAQ